MTTRPRIVAHRGASLERPENTIAAYQQAIAIGADFIELDVHVTRDGVVVCHHDDALHGSGKPLYIAEHRLSELRMAFPNLPTLQEVAALPFGSTGLMVELKEGKLPFVSEVFEQLQGCVCPSLVLGSFSIDIMRALKQRWPLSQLIGIAEDDKALAAHTELGPRYLAISVFLATAECVQKLRSQGFEVWVWTVDDPAVARSLWTSGVQGIITNDPRTMICFH